MAKHQAKVYVFMEYDYTRDYSAKVWAPTTWKCRVPDQDDRVFIDEQVVEIDIPDDFNPIPQQVAALNEKKREALAAYQATITEIEERLSKLLALEAS